MDASHQAATLAVQIGPHFFLEGSLVKVSRTNGHTQSHSFFFGFACDVLVHGEGAVDAAAFLEKRADGSARAFGRDEDHVDIFGDVNVCDIFEDWREAVGEVERLQRVSALVMMVIAEDLAYLALGKHRLDV